MTTQTRLIAFYFINLLIYFLIGVIFGGNITKLLRSLAFWLFPLFIVLVGQLFGLLTVVVQKPSEKSSVYHYSRLIVTVCMALFFFGSTYFDWKHERDFGNIEANKDYFEYFNGEHKYEQKIAFDTLSKKFANPNGFRILGNFTDTKDTSINGDTTTIYSLTLFYQKKNNKNNFKAGFKVINDVANLIYYDQLLSLNDYTKIVHFRRDVQRTFTKAWREMPDSIKEQIKKHFPEFAE